MVTLPRAYDNIEQYISDLCHFIETPLVRQITGGIHVNDALIYNAWEALPQEWTSWWLSLPNHRLAQQDLIDSIDEAGAGSWGSDNSAVAHIAQTRPASLTQWLKRLRSLALSRLQRDGPAVALPEALMSRMKTKKTAEISRAVAYIRDICQRRRITRIVDMGSGQGYVSITLAYLFPYLQVLAIDGSESQVAGAKAFVASLGISESRVKHLVHWIDGSNSLAEKIHDWAGDEECMLVGLHACGNLSEHMIRYFADIPFITELAVIGCCYNHIVPLSPDCPEGFPISNTLRQHSVRLSATALMTACQAPNNWPTPSLDSNMHKTDQSPFARRRSYRAILEKLFHDKGVKLNAEERPAWGIRKGDMATFSSFARRAIHYLDLEKEGIFDADLLAYEERYRDCEAQISILWTLSVLCCKVVESVVALDRYLFLIEHGARSVEVVPIFDFKVSPRNLMITASKKN